MVEELLSNLVTCEDSSSNWYILSFYSLLRLSSPPSHIHCIFCSVGNINHTYSFLNIFIVQSPISIVCSFKQMLSSPEELQECFSTMSKKESKIEYVQH